MGKESVTGSVKEVVKERLKNPVWGFIALSWCGFNWQNIAVLLMSKSAVTTRIEQITTAENFYWWSLGIPVAVGLALSIASPYINYGIAVTKRWVEAKEREGVKRALIAECEMQKETAEKRIEAQNAEKLAQAIKDAEIAKQEEKTEQIILQTDELKKEIIRLQESIGEYKSRADAAELLTESVVKEYWQWVDKAAELVVAIDDFVRVDNSTSIADFKKSIETIIEKHSLSDAVKAVRERQHERMLKNINKMHDKARK